MPSPPMVASSEKCFMKSLILLEIDGASSDELVVDLKSRHLLVTRSTMGRGGVARIEAGYPLFDIVVLDMSLDRAIDWDTLDRVHRFVVMHAPRSMILCFSRIYRGPRMKLRAERKGARFIYVR